MSGPASGHDWEQTAWDSFFRCRRCGLEVNQRRGIPAPDDFGICRARGPHRGRQATIEQWARRVLGDAALDNRAERGLRVAEEAIELAQALCVSTVDLHRLVDYVYARPVGSAAQEIAGTMVTLYAAAASIGADADSECAREIERIHTPEIEDKVRRRQAEKRMVRAASDPVPE